tara:strand:+ start:102 stop:1046 length:945 start_codon:yes stop_codon:yes gene_type:complete
MCETYKLQTIRKFFKNKYILYNIKMKTKVLGNLETKIKDSKEIKDSSKVAYISRIHTLENAENFPFKSQDQLLELIEELNPNENLNTELNIINQFFIFMEMYDKFKDMFSDTMIEDLKVEQDMLNSAKKEKVNEKRENDISWKELQSVKGKIDSMKRDEKLLYMLYINPGIGFVPRNDFTNMAIVDTEEDAKDDNENYYVKDDNKFIINEYKTAKKYGKKVFDAPKETIPLIEKNKDFVFEDGHGTSMKENTVQHKISRMMEKLTGKKVTINTIRRSFANHIAELPEKERIKIAHKMGHSGHTNKKMYKYEDSD